MTLKKNAENPSNKLPKSSNPIQSMNWEEEKKKIQYDTELKTLKNLLNRLVELDKTLYDINAGRHQYHKG